MALRQAIIRRMSLSYATLAATSFCAREPHYCKLEYSNTSVGDKFFCVFFSIHTEKLVIKVWVSKIPTEIFENP